MPPPDRWLGTSASACRWAGAFYAQPFELNIGEPPIGEQVPAGRKVVLCTDLICTENTVRRAVRMIAGRER